LATRGVFRGSESPNRISKELCRVRGTSHDGVAKINDQTVRQHRWDVCDLPVGYDEQLEDLVIEGLRQPERRWQAFIGLLHHENSASYLKS
jgi:hypothetical protein